jgi:hypothetical protein
MDEKTQEFVEVLKSMGVEGSGCDEWRVQDLEAALNVRFPAAYRAFLQLAGQGFRPFEGSHYAVEHDLAELQRIGRRILKHSGQRVPDDAFVFLTHQGFVALFFLLDDGPDPAVFEFVEGWPAIKQSSRFTDLLRARLTK